MSPTVPPPKWASTFCAIGHAEQQGQETPFWGPWVKGVAYRNEDDALVQRGHHFALVDEADNVFIDEARTPLIISTPTRLATEEEQVVFLWADKLAKAMLPNEALPARSEEAEAGADRPRQTAAAFLEPAWSKGRVDRRGSSRTSSRPRSRYRFRLDQHYA